MSNVMPPGEVLLEDFMTPQGLTATQLAADICVPSSVILGILAGALPISREVAAKLAGYFSTSPQFWLNLQAEYEAGAGRGR